ncbi:hypothetical protein WDU94_003514 [Cyamophila willieti]
MSVYLFFGGVYLFSIRKFVYRLAFGYEQEKEQVEDFIDAVNEKDPPTEKSYFYQGLKNNIDQVVSRLGLIRKVHLGKKHDFRKPWYNSQCRELQYLLRKHFRRWRRKGKNEDLEKYIKYKKQYFQTCHKKRETYEKNFKDKLSNLKNAGDYWKTVKKFKTKKGNKCDQVPFQAWCDYAYKIFPQSDSSHLETELVFTDVLRETMDSDFTLGELEMGIAKLKNNKSPGPDFILNEYLKCLGEKWKKSLLSFLNFIFDRGEIPKQITQSYMFMVHKKGDPTLPENYRNIALLNNVFKLVTHMISQRVLCWIEDNKLFMEAQAGFRPGRGCTDNIFTLSSIVSLHLIQQRKLYAAFIDFKSAFSEVDHRLLFEKMFKFGVTGKVLSLLKKIYQQAEVQIRVADQFTPPHRINKGLLQGDSISPLNFIIFINDLEEFMRNNGGEGVSISSTTDIILLLYCDDLILLATSKIDLQRKLNLLYLYCQQNKMIVNETKSKIVIFRRGGRVARSDVFQFNGRPVEVVSDYNYLGILFSSHGVFHKASQQALSKGRTAVGCVKNVLVNSKTDSFECRMKLFESIVKTTLLYSAEVWACRYEETIEKCQLQFFKSVYCLPRNTPNYMVRLEMGVVSLSYTVFKQMVEWWLKLLSMTSDRYPKLCYLELRNRDLRPSNIVKYNWVSLLKIKLCQLGYSEVWEAQCPIVLKDVKEGIYDSYYRKLIENDKNRVFNSTYTDIYSSLLSSTQYLRHKGPIDRLRVLAQLRLTGSKIRIYVNRILYEWDQFEICSICNIGEPENLEHFLMVCPHYQTMRTKFLGGVLSTGGDLRTILNSDCRKSINNVYYYVTAALKLRSFLRNE